MTESDIFIKRGVFDNREDSPEIKRWRRGLTGLTVFSVVLLVALITLVICWHVQRKAYVDHEATMCVPKSDFDSHRDAKCPSELESRDDTCCGSASKILSKFTEQLTLKTFTDHTATRMLSDENCGENDRDSFKHLMTHKPVVALLSGLDETRTEAQGEGHMLYWNETSQKTILNNVTYTNGNLRVPTKGFYYVYSQVILDKFQNKNAENQMSIAPQTEPFFSYHIYRTSSHTLPRRQLILETSNSACNIASPDNQLSVSVGSVFELEEGDWLCVETSQPRNIVNSHESNHFGLYSV